MKFYTLDLCNENFQFNDWIEKFKVYKKLFNRVNMLRLTLKINESPTLTNLDYIFL